MQEDTNKISRFVAGLKKAAFDAVDALCTILVDSEAGDSRTVVALKAACEVRKAQQRRRSRNN